MLYTYFVAKPKYTRIDSNLTFGMNSQIEFFLVSELNGFAVGLQAIDAFACFLTQIFNM